MRVALILGGGRQREHIITQPAHTTPGGSPTCHWTLCDRRVHHGPDTIISGPLDSEKMATGGLCRQCEERMAHAEMAERYATSDYVRSFGL